jgi:hypothetical protein
VCRGRRGSDRVGIVASSRRVARLRCDFSQLQITFLFAVRAIPLARTSVFVRTLMLSMLTPGVVVHLLFIVGGI